MPINIKVYLDSNVFISYIRQEIGGGFRQLGEESKRFFAFCSANGACLFLSSLFFKEVESITGLGKNDTLGTLRALGVAIEIAKDLPEYHAEEKTIRQKFAVHFPDSLHLAIARHSGCEFIISWNKPDFQGAADFLPCLAPTEFAEKFH